jgi:tetratricopeptide (TPR) repeat protein
LQEYQATTYHDLGILYTDTSRPARAKDAYDKALEIRSRLVRAEPDNDEFQLGLERSHNALSGYYLDNGNVAQAEKSNQQAIEIAQHLVNKDPTSPEYLRDLASAYYNLGFGYQRANQNNKAERAYLDALKLEEKLAGEHPTVVAYQKLLASAQNMLGSLYWRMDRLTDADVFYQKAQATRAKLHQAYPLVPEFAVELAGSYSNRGRLLCDRRDYSAAQSLLLDSQTILQAVLGKDDRNFVARRYLLNVHRTLSSIYRTRGQTKEAEDAGRSLAEEWEKLVHAFPDSAADMLELGGALCNYGHRLFENDKPGPALDAYTRAIATLDSLMQKTPALCDHGTTCVTRYGAGRAR